MRIFQYIKRSQHLVLEYSGKDSLNGFTDANWAREADRRSVGGYVFMLAGGAISWSSKRQNTVATSSCEAEYIAASEASKEAIWLQRLLDHFGHKIPQVPLQIDNQSAIQLAKNPMSHARSKHIEVRWHFIREKVEEGLIKVQFVGTNDQVADGLTKPLVGEKLSKFVSNIGLRTSSASI
jgi:hypothetical protein